MNITRDSTTYIDRITAHWYRTINTARCGGATAIQLQCLESLSSEFGAHSGMMLRDECFWTTAVDKDGDVLLTFPESFFLLDGSVTSGSPTQQIQIDYMGVLTSLDLVTKHITVYNPRGQKEDAEFKNYEPLWVLYSSEFKRFTQPSMLFQYSPRIGDKGGYNLTLQNGGNSYEPCLIGPITAKAKDFSCDFEVLSETVIRYEGELYSYSFVARDPVTDAAVYSLQWLSVAKVAGLRLVKYFTGRPLQARPGKTHFIHAVL